MQTVIKMPNYASWDKTFKKILVDLKIEISFTFISQNQTKSTKSYWLEKMVESNLKEKTELYSKFSIRLILCLCVEMKCSLILANFQKKCWFHVILASFFFVKATKIQKKGWVIFISMLYFLSYRIVASTSTSRLVTCLG